MLLALIAIHAMLAICTPAISRILGTRSFFLLALPPLATAAFLIVHASTVLSGGAITESTQWIPSLGIALNFRVGLLQWLLGLIVSVVGVLVLLYCRWYFGRSMPNLSGGVLLAFAGAMIGLVTADDLVVLFIFWELTTIFSYLLIGHDPTRRANRGAAHTAMVVTTAGGLTMLLGIIALGHQAGTFSLSAIVENPPLTPLAGLGMVVAHALFKSTLFMTVGIIDHSAGTRDLNQLSGLGRKAPVLATVGGLAALSMAGIPPLIGFTTKEAAFESVEYLVRGDQYAITPLAGMFLAAALVFGSALTVAYSLRWWWGAFATKPEAPELQWHAPAVAMTAIPGLLAAASLVGGFLGYPLTTALSTYADTVRFGETSHGFGLWHGFTAPLLMSAIALVSGVALFWFRSDIARIQSTFPKSRSMEETYHASMKLLDRLAVETTARVQRGSLPVYLGTILVTFVVLSVAALMDIRFWPQVRWGDSLAQLAVCCVIVAAALGAAKSRGRVRGIMLTGATGYGLAVLFVMWGAPDLALTQLLVETVSLVVFVLVVRKLPRYFTNRPLSSSRWWRVLLAAAVGTTVTLIALVAAGARLNNPISDAWYKAAYEIGFGHNVVNVALVDTRAWDTFGEISVLVIAATGVASLIFLQTRVGDVKPTSSLASDERKLEADSSPAVWLRAGQTMSPFARSLMFEVVTRMLFWLLVLMSVYLLIAGHNAPGGGFAGGLVAGMALMTRYLSAGRHELDDAAPFDAGRLLGTGLLLAIGTAIAPVFFGGAIFQSYDLHLDLPGPDTISLWGHEYFFMGDLHLVTSTVFDIGVYLVVVGTLLDLARSLGSGIDTHQLQDRAPTPLADSTKALPGSRYR